MKRTVIPSVLALNFLRCLERVPFQSRRTIIPISSRCLKTRHAALRPFHPRGAKRFSTAVAPKQPDDEIGAEDGKYAYIPALTACPGCGALAQVVEPGEPGYYTRKRKVVDRFINAHVVEDREGPPSQEELTVSKEIPNSEIVRPPDLHRGTSSTSTALQQDPKLPLCDRCHHLLHHSSGNSIIHPSIEVLQDTIAESPWKTHHVYHVLDAADFPLSVVPRIHELISAAPQRSKNRRAKQIHYRHGGTTELSFVITRADLLAPKKEQVDSLMPYLTDVLREALASKRRDFRLGNVHCVSSKRGWWTPQLKKEIWMRGGAHWMVGKVNVGKSNLFEVVFPKGNSHDMDLDKLRSQARQRNPKATLSDENLEEQLIRGSETSLLPSSSEAESILLPPARLETAYPSMPTVSALPGTTASPIRIPFGRGRGELIDLPGLSRSNLANYVLDEHKPSLIMEHRITPEQHSIKPGQSLILGGGLVRITPARSDLVILAYPFVPLTPHVTSTAKAVALQSGASERPEIASICNASLYDNVRLAGTFSLDTDVTKYHTGPLLRKSRIAVREQLTRLRFRVLSTDVLIEGVGWVELVAQVRKRNEGDEVPKVEVYTPEGSFIGVRKPMCAWALGGKKDARKGRRSIRRKGT